MMLGTLEVDLATRSLRRDGEALYIGPRAFDILVVLLSAAGRIVTKDELMDAVWPATVVEENNLHVHISMLRKLLGPERNLIVTIPGRGYQLIQRRPSSANRTVPAPVSQNDGDLPARHRTLTGRDGLVSNVTAMLDTKPILTLVGPGGVGKTSAAIEVAHAAVKGRFVITRFVKLATVATPEMVWQKVASAFGLWRPDDCSGVEKLIAALPEDHTLLVLDNAEHVIDAVARLVDSLSTRRGNLRVLLTSREPLRVLNETIFQVGSLDVPLPGSSVAEVLDCSAVQMFLKRAQQSGCDADYLKNSARLVGEICCRLDGNPFAIELAARRVGALGVRGVHELLDDRFALLGGGYRTALVHHQTLRASFDWSFALLSPCSQKLFGQAAAFRNAFTLDALCALACDKTYTLSDVARDIAELTEKSLVSAVSDKGGYRFCLSESARAYALEKLRGERVQLQMSTRYAGPNPGVGHTNPSFGTDWLNKDQPTLAYDL